MTFKELVRRVFFGEHPKGRKEKLREYMEKQRIRYEVTLHDGRKIEL